MKALLVVLATLTFASIAQARPDTTKMTCAQASGLVQSEGSIVMTYAHHPRAGRLFKRFVKSVHYCGHSQEAVPFYGKTTDSPRCYIGKVCRDRDTP